MRPPVSRGAAAFGVRPALGFSESTTPGLLFVALGILLGPAALDALSGTVLAQLDPVVSMALAAVGVFVGAGLASAHHTRATLAGAAGQGCITFAAVWTTMLFLMRQWELPLTMSSTTAAAVLALCSMASAAILPEHGRSRSASDAAMVADLDDVPVVALGSVAVPVLAGVATLWLSLSLAIVAGVMIATAGVLLFRHAESTPERGVFVTGIILLLGGSAAFISVSPLTTGFVAGALWRWHHGSLDGGILGPDLRRLQHPLIGLLLITAGASMQWSWAALWLSAPLAIVRLAGKTAGALLFARLTRLPPGLLSAALLPPGMLGIALALNIQQVFGGGDTLLLSSVTAATMISEVLARLVLSREDVA